MNDVLSLLQTPPEKAARWWGKNHEAENKRKIRTALFEVLNGFYNASRQIFIAARYKYTQVNYTSMQIFKFYRGAALLVLARLMSIPFCVYVTPVQQYKISKRRSPTNFCSLAAGT